MESQARIPACMLKRGRTRAACARLASTIVYRQLYVKSSVVNGCIATPTNLKLLLRALLHHIGAQGDERDAELAVAKVQCANESSTNSTDGLVALTAATMPRCAAASRLSCAGDLLAAAAAAAAFFCGV